MANKRAAILGGYTTVPSAPQYQSQMGIQKSPKFKGED